MATYLIDAVGMLRYLVDALPGAADGAMRRAEEGIDVVRTPDVQLAEVLYQVARSGVVAEVDLQRTPNEALRRLVTDGPVEIAPVDEHVLAVYGAIADQYSMRDGLLVACHRVSGEAAILTNDAAFDHLPTEWD